MGNSLREARERRGIDFAQAEVATKIRSTLLDIQYGRVADTHGWLTRLA